MRNSNRNGSDASLNSGGIRPASPEGMRMRISVTVILGLLPVLFASQQVFGANISYTETVTATGSLGGTFFDGLVTLSFMGNTSNVTTFPDCCYKNTVGTMTVFVQGLGSATFTDLMGAVVNNKLGAAGLSDFTEELAVLFTNNSQFKSYNLRSAIGPVSGTATFNSNFTFPTTRGAFVLISVPQGATYTARTVPEPSSMILLGIGLAGLAGTIHRRTAKV